jgi:hypothetical protein
MPTSLPDRSPAKLKSVPARQAPEGFNIWVGCIGLAATILASFIYFSGGDGVGAALILVLAAIVVLAMMRISAGNYGEL